MEQEPEQLPDLHVSKMSQEDLDTLMNIISPIQEIKGIPTFEAVWAFFIEDYPDAETVYSFFEEVEDLGYYIKEEIEHPYAKEYAGAHVGMTENGTAFHMTCSADFAETEDYKKLMGAIDKAAKG